MDRFVTDNYAAVQRFRRESSMSTYLNSRADSGGARVLGRVVGTLASLGGRAVAQLTVRSGTLV